MGAQIAELACALLIVAGVAGQLITQTLDGFIIGVKGFEFFQQFLLQGGDVGGLYAVFARQGLNGIEPLFEVQQASGIGIKVVEKTIEFTHGLFALDLGAGQQVGGFAQGAGVVINA